MNIIITIAFKCSRSEIISVKERIEALGEGIWASYTGFQRSYRRMIISAPSNEKKEEILSIVKSIQHVEIERHNEYMGNGHPVC